MTDLRFEVSGTVVRSKGLRRINDFEIEVDTLDFALVDEARDMLEFIERYLLYSERRILAEETMLMGFWSILFRRKDRRHLEVWELSGDDYVYGARRTLMIRGDQRRVCGEHSLDFDPPYGHLFISVDDGVYEGLSVEGRRYANSADDKTGWILTTERYNGDVASLKLEHGFHMPDLRPDVVPYLALPPGSRFWLSPTERRVEVDPSLLDDDEGP